MAKAVTDLRSAIDYIRELQAGSSPSGGRLSAIAVPKAVRDKIVDELGEESMIPVTRKMLQMYDDQAPTEVRVLGVLIKEQKPNAT
jgi:hypothetical protein